MSSLTHWPTSRLNSLSVYTHWQTPPRFMWAASLDDIPIAGSKPRASSWHHSRNTDSRVYDYEKWQEANAMRIIFISKACDSGKQYKCWTWWTALQNQQCTLLTWYMHRAERGCRKRGHSESKSPQDVTETQIPKKQSLYPQFTKNIDTSPQEQCKQIQEPQRSWEELAFLQAGRIRASIRVPSSTLLMPYAKNMLESIPNNVWNELNWTPCSPREVLKTTHPVLPLRGDSRCSQCKM